MRLEELIGKTITNIFQVLEYESYGLDKGECFVELDNNIIIDIPYSFDGEVRTKDLDEKAISIFNDLSDDPIYHVNREGRSIKEIADKYVVTKLTLLQKMKYYFLFGKIPSVQRKPIKEYESYKIEWKKNKLKYIKGSVIKDLIIFGEDDEKAFLELDNGYFISETNFSMNGTGRIGINLYEKLSDITTRKGNNFKRISDQKN